MKRKTNPTLQIRFAFSKEDVEIAMKRMAKDTTPGFDGKTYAQFRNTAAIMNVFALLGRVSCVLSVSNTTLIPEFDVPIQAKHFRLISLLAIIVRVFH